MKIEKILFVDDDQNILDGYKRTLRNDFQIETAASAIEALTAIQSQSTFAVIVSDMRMPGMDGIQFLARVKESCPESIRIMLTGNADQQTAIDAVNEGSIFRFLNKPCSPQVMAKTLSAAIEQYRLIRVEKDLIEKTLSASVQTLTDVLSLTNPTAFGRSMRVRHQVRQLTNLLKIENPWQADLAAMLSQIGCITIPEEVLQKVNTGRELNQEELQMLQGHPQIAFDLLAKIPRLEAVAQAIAYQEKRFNGGGFPYNNISGEEIPIAARILKVALDFDKLTQAKITYLDAHAEMERRTGWYDPEIVAALRIAICNETVYETQCLSVDDLRPGMILAQDVITVKGMLLISSGNEVTSSLCLRMTNFLKMGIIKEKVNVSVPKK